MSDSHLRFQLKGECFAVPVSKVLKILEYGNITKVPKAPPFLIGVMNWQGSLLPVVDLNMKLGFPKTQIRKESCILVLELATDSDKYTIGCLVDEVKAVLSIDQEQIIASPSIGEKYKSDLVLGMVPSNELFIILLDFNKIFETDEVLLLSNNQLSTETENNLSS